MTGGIARVGAVLLVLVLGIAGCGDDDDGDDEGAPTTTTAEDSEASAEGEGDGGSEGALSLTLTETGLEGLPDELVAGVVSVELTDDTEAAGGEVNFTRVEAGTTEEEFLDAIVSVFGGGPIPDVLLDTSGVIESSTILLDEGEYVVWYDLASNLERESTADDIVTTSFTVAEGDADAELPDADGTVTATDYDFSVDVQAGPSTINFFNDSSAQLHHVILVDFGTNDPAVIEANLPAILEAEDPNAVPEGVDGSQIDFEFGGSGVFGPDSAGTFEATFEEGNTYAALCFIQDREGGPPHAIAHQMYEVFQVEAG